MTQELWILSVCVGLGLVQLLASAKASIQQRGSTWAAGSRDTPAKPLVGAGARLDRAFKNFLETFPFFAVAVLTAHASNCHNGWALWGGRVYLAARLVYVPAYLTAVPFLRTAAWFTALAAIIAVAVAPAL